VTSGAQKWPSKPGTACVVHAGGASKTDRPPDHVTLSADDLERIPGPVA
jgi:hypothetical protein